MANNRLTWRDVAAPDYGSSIRGAEAANRMFQDALGGLSTSLGSFITNRKAAQDEALLKQQQEAEAGYLRQMAAVSGDTEQEAALRRGLSGNTNVSNDFLSKQLTDFRNAQLTGNTTAEKLRQTTLENLRTNRDNEYMDEARPIVGGMNAYVSSGGDKPYLALSDEQRALIDRLPAEEQTRLAAAWSGEQTSNLGRNSTRQNMGQSATRFSNEIGDRNENRLVEDLVGAARAETPFIDEQQALIADYYRNGDITPRMYEKANQQLQRAVSGGTGGGGTGTAAGGTSTGGGNTLIDPSPSVLDSSSPYGFPDVQDVVQDVDNLITDLTRGAGTVAARGVQRSDSARATDISPSDAVGRVMKAKAFENADPDAVQDAIYEVMRMMGNNASYAEAADIVAMSPGSSFGSSTYNKHTAQYIADQWLSPNLGKDRETLQEINREQTKLETARESINKDSQKLDEMVNHAFRNGLPQDTPAIRDLQEKIQLGIENLGKEAERIREKNLGERIRNPATGEFGYPAEIREAEAKAARSRAEAQAQAEEDARNQAARDAQRIQARMEELEQRWGINTLQKSTWVNGKEYRRLKAELNKVNKVLEEK